MAASTSNVNPSVIVEVRGEYRDIVTVKLSNKSKYNVWNTQMLCLLSSHEMLCFIDGTFVSPDDDQKGKGKVVGDVKAAWMRSDFLVKGWILGSLSEEVAIKVINHLTWKHKESGFTAKHAWDELQSRYGPSIAVADKEEITSEGNSKPEDAKSEAELKEKREFLCDKIVNGDMDVVRYIIKEPSLEPTDKITKNGNTALHVAVGSSTKNQEILKDMLAMILEENTLLDLVNSDGSTLLHVAAIVGNTEAANILLQRNPDFLLAKDNEGHTPLAVSIHNMHTDTSRYLMKHIDTDIGKYQKTLFSGTSGDELLVLAISCKDFCLAEDLLKQYYKTIHGEAVLMAIAQNYPCELNFWETKGAKRTKEYWRALAITRFESRINNLRFCVQKMWLYVTVWPFTEKRADSHYEAKKLLNSVCTKIAATTHGDHYYTNPIFEATRLNAFDIVNEIMSLFPNTIWSTNEDGHNFIQYAVINRSEKIYNLLYQMSEHKNIYKTIKDSSGNNLLHLAARLAPSNKLNLISGAALQLQRELQWFKEVEGFVRPLNKIEKNSCDETPEMVFTSQHKDLVIEGEKWMKATAESYTITAALITTIVFAAAITVPGGNKDTGEPNFSSKATFTIFAISDAISLFTAITSLLMFLSILTTRFAEQDFLFKLPKRLIIGLATLFISTMAMIIAFGATLLLVFGQGNSWILLPIGALTCLPITSFVTLQFPLIADLMSATYGRSIFVKKKIHWYFY